MSTPQEPDFLGYEVRRKLEENESTGQVSSESKAIFINEKRNRRKMQGLKPSTHQEGPFLPSDNASEKRNADIFTLISRVLKFFYGAGKTFELLIISFAA